MSLPASRARVWRYDSCGPVIGSSPVTHSSVGFSGFRCWSLGFVALGFVSVVFVMRLTYPERNGSNTCSLPRSQRDARALGDVSRFFFRARSKRSTAITTASPARESCQRHQRLIG